MLSYAINQYYYNTASSSSFFHTKKSEEKIDNFIYEHIGSTGKSHLMRRLRMMGIYDMRLSPHTVQKN